MTGRANVMKKLICLVMTFFIVLSVSVSNVSASAELKSISDSKIISLQEQDEIISIDTQTGELSSFHLSDYSDRSAKSSFDKPEELSCPAVFPEEMFTSQGVNSFLPGNGIVTPNQIIGGVDSRVEANPYIWGIAYLTSYWKNGTVTYGTAFIFANGALMTAGHCVYDSSKGWVSYVTVSPSRKGLSCPFGTLRSTTIHTNTAWISSGDSNYDYAVVEVGSQIGKSTGLFGFTTSSSTGTSVIVNGYAGGKQQQQWLMSGKITATTTNKVAYAIDTNDGQSGSPIYNNSYEAVGIHTGGNSTNNSGTRITSSLYNWLVTFR